MSTLPLYLLNCLLILSYVPFDNDMHTSNLFKQNRKVEDKPANFLTHTLLIVYLSKIGAHTVVNAFLLLK